MSKQLEWFGSSPKMPPKTSLKGEWQDTELSQLRTFRDIWGARRLYDLWNMSGEPVKWLSSTKLVTSEGMIISSPDLEKIVEYDLKRDEVNIEFPEPFLSEATAFKNKVAVKSMRGNSRTEKPQVEEGERPKREKKERVPRPSKDGLITIGQIAEEMKVEPRIARGILRDAKTPKPDAGWAWPQAKVEEIKAIIKKGMK